MKRIVIFFLLTVVSTTTAQVARKRTVKLMGSRFDITIVAKDEAAAEAYIDTAIAEISRIENLISDWIPTTQLSEVNKNAGIQPVKVDAELFDLTQRAISFSKLTDGAFDISYASMDKIWKFDGSMTEMPSPEAIKKSVEKVGYQNIILNKEDQTIFLKLPGMKLGFGSIGKGYAADKTKQLLMQKGVKAGIVNASGDMNSWGRQPNSKKWKVGITNPMNPEKTFAAFSLEDNAVVTSGTYEKFVVLDGKKYAHIIDTRTGYPARGIASVTVFAPSAELANGLSTAIIVMGQEAGMNLIAQIPNVSCVIVTDEGKIFKSKKIDLKKTKID